MYTKPYQDKTNRIKIGQEMTEKYDILIDLLSPDGQTHRRTDTHIVTDARFIVPSLTSVRHWGQKLYGSLTNLQRTASLILETGVPI